VFTTGVFGAEVLLVGLDLLLVVGTVAVDAIFIWNNGVLSVAIPFGMHAARVFDNEASTIGAGITWSPSAAFFRLSTKLFLKSFMDTNLDSRWAILT